jgi:hypothetical protein
MTGLNLRDSGYARQDMKRLFMPGLMIEMTACNAKDGAR